jgi:hypothetical protein
VCGESVGGEPDTHVDRAEPLVLQRVLLARAEDVHLGERLNPALLPHTPSR